MFCVEGVEEVRSLVARGLDPALPVMRAIGVRQIAAYLAGELSREEALEAGRIATRQYAKRQYTWFANQPPPDWPRFGGVPQGNGFEQALGLLLRRAIA
jgi:tRNA dimethylallyltransferase